MDASASLPPHLFPAVVVVVAATSAKGGSLKTGSWPPARGIIQFNGARRWIGSAPVTVDFREEEEEAEEAEEEECRRNPLPRAPFLLKSLFMSGVTII